METDDFLSFDVAGEFMAYERCQPVDEPEGGVWCIRSKQDVNRLKQRFSDIVEQPMQTALEDFFALLNDLRDLYCTAAENLKDESLNSSDIFWIKAAISYAIKDENGFTVSYGLGHHHRP